MSLPLLRHSLLITALMLAGTAADLRAQSSVRASGSGSASQGANARSAQQRGSRELREDPGQLYLTAYRLCRESENLAARKSYNNALLKGRQAEKVLARIVRDHPDWKPNLVAARRKLLADNMELYRTRSREARVPTGREPGSPIATDVPLDDRVPTMIDSNYRPIELPDYDSTDKRLYNALARAQEECRRMAVAYKELSSKYDEVQKRLNTSEVEGQMYKSRYDALQKQIASEREAGNRVVDSLSRQLADMEAMYQASEQARREAEARVAELEQELTDTREQLARVTQERDALRAENEQLRAIVELNSPEKTKALLDQNLTLAEQLKRAEQHVAELEAQIGSSADQNTVLSRQLDTARAEADRIRDEMSALYEENMGYRRRVSDLTDRLNALEADLNEQAKKPVADPALAEENRLLREVIEKQRRTLSMQNQGLQLLMDTYRKMKEQRPEVVEAMQKLEDESNPGLSDADRRLLEAVKAGRDGGDAVREGLQAETLADLAAKAFTKGRFTAAEQMYRTLYDLQPDHVAGLVNLGTILLYRNKCEEAVSYLEKATRLAPDLAIAAFQSGVAYYRLDRMEEARVMFRRTIELDPANAEAFFYLANIEGITNGAETALKYYAAAVKLRPDLGDAHYNMARLYAEMNRIPDAARAYDRAVRNGALPDPEFENYLRSHPDTAKAPGADLVEAVKPEDEAARLREQDPEFSRLLEEHSRGAETPADSGAEPPADGAATPSEGAESSAEGSAPEGGTPSGDGSGEGGLSSRGYAPSPAGRSHETDPSLFRSKTTTIRTKGKRKTIKLRMKLPAPPRLRDSKTGEYIDAKQSK
ncbi:MAG TPA: tetratricopeptide repeat protein [Candidatus Akkermansia intestinavium]|nr:tetratricopeptide repeat protein [Candidatus Akkermansia intestinavium]